MSGEGSVIEANTTPLRGPRCVVWTTPALGSDRPPSTSATRSRGPSGRATLSVGMRAERTWSGPGRPSRSTEARTAPRLVATSTVRACPSWSTWRTFSLPTGQWPRRTASPPSSDPTRSHGDLKSAVTTQGMSPARPSASGSRRRGPPRWAHRGLMSR